MKRASAFATEFFKRYSLCASYKLKAPCIIIDIVDCFRKENGKITYRNRRIFGVKVTRLYSSRREFLFRVCLSVSFGFECRFIAATSTQPMLYLISDKPPIKNRIEDSIWRC